MTGSASRRVAAAVTAVGLLAGLAACGRSAGGGGTAGDVSPTKGLVLTTPAGTKPVPSVTWAVYRPVYSLNPGFAFDYPENTAVSLMCESLLRQAPDGSIGPGLATLSTPSATRLVFTLRPGVTFWDGHPVTPADVVYSLDWMDNPAASYYTKVFSRVASIAATGADQVTITLKQPDYWLAGELSSMPGVVFEKAFAQRAGKNFGQPGTGIMCTGAYKFKSWPAGGDITAAANAGYWDSAVKPLVGQIVITGVADTTSLTSGLLTGSISGTYYTGLPTLDQLMASKAVKVYQGPGQATDALIVANDKGVLGDLRVREALSLALDRKAIIANVYKGAALPSRWLANPGTFGYGKSVFTKAYDSSPELTQNLAKARKLVREAGAAGKTITIGTSSQIAGIAAVTGAYQQAAEAIGLKVNLKTVSAADYGNLFVLSDTKARAGMDCFLTVNYGDYADPAALLSTFVLPGGSQNFDNFTDPKLTALLERARGTASPAARAALVAKAEELTMQELPWIPDVQPTVITILGKGLTGAYASFSFMFSPWADQLGGS